MNNNSITTDTSILQFPNKIVLFDGVCNLCEKSVQFILKHDQSNEIYFAPLQSTIGIELLKKYGLPNQLDGVVYIINNKAYIKSAAAFQLLKAFGWQWQGLRLFSILPIFITDFFYDIIANNRYKWFGKKDACMLPTKEMKQRFLEN